MLEISIKTRHRVPWWHSGLRIQCCHCVAQVTAMVWVWSHPWPGKFHIYGHSRKKKEKRPGTPEDTLQKKQTLKDKSGKYKKDRIDSSFLSPSLSPFLSSFHSININFSPGTVLDTGNSVLGKREFLTLRAWSGDLEYWVKRWRE